MVKQNIFHAVEKQIQENILTRHLLTKSRCVIVALSGGADSVALLVALHRLGYQCVGAHCNFHLRGEESNRDELHVTNVTRQLDIKCEVAHFDVKKHVSKYGVSIEMACRELRYEWFEQLRRKYDAQAIAVAHHRDDDVETMFLNLLRGSGIAGVAAMKWKNGFVVRPMLNLSRDEVVDYLYFKDVEFVVDSTNLETDYLRNRLRNVVLPVLREEFPGAYEMMSKSLGFLKEHRKIYDNAIDMAKAKYQKGNIIKLSKIIEEYVSPTTLLYELLSPYDFNISQVKSIIDLKNGSGKKFYSNRWVAIVNRGEIQLEDIDDFKDENQFVFEISETGKLSLVNEKRGKKDESALPFEMETKVFDKNQSDYKADKWEIFLDAIILEQRNRFVLRHWREGDRISPFGMNGSKKLSDVFSDAYENKKA